MFATKPSVKIKQPSLQNQKRVNYFSLKQIFWKQSAEVFSSIFGKTVMHVNSINLLSLSPAGIYLFNVNNSKTRTLCEIYSELTITIQDDVRKVNFVTHCFHCWMTAGKLLNRQFQKMCRVLPKKQCFYKPLKETDQHNQGQRKLPDGFSSVNHI